MYRKTLLLSSLVLVLYSCRFHQGNMVSNAAIGPDSEIVGFAQGSAQTTLVFGLGGLNTQNLIRDAKEAMYSSYPLKKGQAYANLSVDISRSFYPFVGLPIVVKNQATVSADLVNLDSDKVSDELQPLFNTLQKSYTVGGHPWTANLWLQKGDSVLYLYGDQAIKAFVQEIIRERTAIIVGDDLKPKRAALKHLFLFQESAVVQGQPKSVGNIVTAKIYGYNTRMIVIGINPDRVLTRTNVRHRSIANKDLIREVE